MLQAEMGGWCGTNGATGENVSKDNRAQVELAEEESEQLRDRENTTDAKTVSVKQEGAFSTERECIQEEAEASG